MLSGIPVHVVAARLSHADQPATLRVYAHVVRTAEAAAQSSSLRPSRPSEPGRTHATVSNADSKRAPSKIGRGL
jgi:hypothetical protein